MDGEHDAALQDIDGALLRMRRMWMSPASQSQLERDVGEGVPLSAVLVVDAVYHGPADARRAGIPDGDGADADARREVTVADVAARLQVEASTASRLVEGARAAGYVQRQRSTVDARRSVLKLTTEGEDLLARAGAFRRGHLARLLAGFTADERRTFAHLLARFADAVAETEPG